ncbi:MAG: VOC family protein [Elainellaceae cyanobacterium]
MAEVLFHLAFPIDNVDQAKAYYGEKLGCQIGRANEKSIILNLYGHQLVGHLAPDSASPQKGIYPRHFGLVFTEEADWEALLERAQENQLPFYTEPKRRFEGSTLEHRTFFLEDPFHNLMEFKYYCHPEAIFGAAEHATVGET